MVARLGSAVVAGDIGKIEYLRSRYKDEMTLTKCLQADSYFCIVEGGIADIRVIDTTGPSDWIDSMPRGGNKWK